MLILKYLPLPVDQLEMLRTVESFDVGILQSQSQDRPDSHTDTSILHNLEVKVWEVGSGCMLTRK